MSTETTTKKSAKKDTPVFRQVKTLELEYDVEVTAELPIPLKILGIHAQHDVAADTPGKTRRHVREIEPKLVYLYDASKKKENVTVLLLRGEAELPLDTDRTYDFIGTTYDRNPKSNNFATAWLVSPKKGG